MNFSTFIVYNHFPLIVQRLIRVRDDELLKAARDIQQIARGSMEKGKSGRKYVFLPNRSSAPGQEPAVQFDKLHGGLAADLEKPGTAAVWSEEEYAPMLEFGTGRMAPRPFLVLAAYRGTGKLVVALSKLEPKLR